MTLQVRSRLPWVNMNCIPNFTLVTRQLWREIAVSICLDFWCCGHNRLLGGSVVEEGNKHQVTHKVTVQVYYHRYKQWEQVKRYFYLALQCPLVSDVHRIMFQTLIVQCWSVLLLCDKIQVGPRLKFTFRMSGSNQSSNDVLEYIPWNSAGGWLSFLACSRALVHIYDIAKSVSRLGSPDDKNTACSL